MTSTVKVERCGNRMEKIPRYVSAVLAVMAIWTYRLHAQEITYELDPAKTTIEFTVPATMHTVHGHFRLKRGSIHFNPATGTAGGNVVVDVKSGDTGNDRRDRKMHREVLQSGNYPEATFTPTHITGAADLTKNPTVQVQGILNVHGSDHPMTMITSVQQSGDQLNSTMRFVIPYTTWGLKNPSTFVLHVSDEVTLEITASGRIAQGTATGASP
jgi:polyisoprenoid-binding protein YceI